MEIIPRESVAQEKSEAKLKDCEERQNGYPKRKGVSLRPPEFCALPVGTGGAESVLTFLQSIT
jgi:hypothetical protein